MKYELEERTMIDLYKDEPKKRSVSRFNPIRILLICGVQGIEFAAGALMLVAVIGFLAGGTVPPYRTICIYVGIGFVLGCISGIRKI
jgi:hypothetical protein